MISHHVNKIQDDRRWTVPTVLMQQEEAAITYERRTDESTSRCTWPICLRVFVCVCETAAALGGATSHSHMRREPSRGNQTKQPRALSRHRAREVHRSERPRWRCCDRARKKRRGTQHYTISQGPILTQLLSEKGRSPERLAPHAALGGEHHSVAS